MLARLTYLPLISSIALVLVTGCTTVDFTVKKESALDEGFHAVELIEAESSSAPAKTIAETQRAERNLVAARVALLKDDHQTSLGYSFDVICSTRSLIESMLVSNAQDTATLSNLVHLHNSALAHAAQVLGASSLDSPKITAEAAGITYECDWSADSDFDASYFDHLVASNTVYGQGLKQSTRSGLGAALVGIREQTEERKSELEYMPPQGVHLAVTMLAENIRAISPTHRKISLRLANPERVQNTTVAGRSMPVAANFSAPFALLLSGQSEFLWGLKGFFQADKRIRNSGIYLLEPYDPNRIPVILTHGLISVPIIWRDIIPELQSDPEIAKRYQFFVFTYPSAYPIARSGLLYRTELAALRAKYDPEGDDPLSNDVIAIGHSMGGVLTHMLVADFGDRLWQEISDTPLDELDMDEDVRADARALTYFEPDPAINEVIFISTPHRGANMATSSLPALLSALVSFPLDVAKTAATTLDPRTLGQLKIKYGDKVTSIQSLRPDSPIAQAMDKSPYREGVIYHSILGDRGKGGTPESSDGVVEYWSSHQDGAASELIVPTGHGAYTDPKAVERIVKILDEHNR